MNNRRILLVVPLLLGVLLLAGLLLSSPTRPRASDPLPPGAVSPTLPELLADFPLPEGAQLVAAGGELPLFAVWLSDLDLADVLAFYDALPADGPYTLTRLPGDETRAVLYTVSDRDGGFGPASSLVIAATQPLRLSLGIAAPLRGDEPAQKYRPLAPLPVDFPTGELPSRFPATLAPSGALLVAAREIGDTVYAIWEGTAEADAMADALVAALEATGRSVERIAGKLVSAIL